MWRAFAVPSAGTARQFDSGLAVRCCKGRGMYSGNAGGLGEGDGENDMDDGIHCPDDRRGFLILDLGVPAYLALGVGKGNGAAAGMTDAGLVLELGGGLPVGDVPWAGAFGATLTIWERNCSEEMVVRRV